MFALGFLIIVGLFFLVVILLSRFLPRGKWRTFFVFSILGAAVVYPFLYLASPSYAKFKELCQRPDSRAILKTKKIDFIYLNWGYASDCSEGPKFIDDFGFSGFDCLKRDQQGKALFRFIKKENWKKGCGLECYDLIAISKPEAEYHSQDRYGFFDGKKRVITYDSTVHQDIPSSEKLRFRDSILMDESEMAFTTHYFYHPYGTGWAKILGMASGSAPVEECKQPHQLIDPRDVYKSKNTTSY